MTKNKNKSTFNKGITIPSLLFIVGVSIFCGLYPVRALKVLNYLKDYISVNFNWLYVFIVTVIICFLLYLALSKYGKIRLGAEGSKPEYSFFSWVSMLFAAGMGIGLMYFGVAEPIAHYMEPSLQGLEHAELARRAQTYTFFHWGIHAWAIYGAVGLALAYFAYRYKLPLSLRSCFYPVFKDKIKGRVGDIIDIFALCTTFFGLTTSLGLGTLQLTAGLKAMNILQDTSFWTHVILITIIMSLAVTSASSGLNKGVKNLSQINVVASLILLAFVLLAGPTVYLLSSFSENIGHYFSHFIDYTFSTYAYEPERQGWYCNWTIIYWAWWISWSPYMGMFIARISKGRTIREFIIAVLFVPSTFIFLWMTVFGNSAIWIDANVANGALTGLADNPDVLLFKFLEYLPMKTLVSGLSIFIIFIFFVTSADSAIFVMNDIASKNAKKTPVWQNIFWGLLLGILALVLLNLDGLKSMLTMTLITALPFGVIMLIFCHSLYKGLYIDRKYYSRDFSPSTEYWSGAFWRERLDKILTTSKRTDVHKYLDETVLPALKELAVELEKRGIHPNVNVKDRPDKSVEIVIQHEALLDFVYGVRAQPKTVSDYLVEEKNAPHIETNRIFIPVTYFGDDRPGYDIQYFTQQEIISDVMKQYERFLSLTSDKQNDLYISSETL